MPKVTIYTDIWGADGIPHTFLGLTNSNGVEKRVGFAPRRTGLLGSGFVGDNSTHEYQHSYEIEISQEQYDNLDNAIKKSEMEPPYYNLPLGIQCTAWAMSMLQEAGIVDQPIAPDIDPKEFYGNFYGDIMGENFGRPFGEFIGDFAGYLQTIIYNPYMQRFGFALKDYGSNINDFLFPFLSPTVYDPITLDLNKDGKIDTTDLNNGVYFDHNGDKVAMKTSWVGKEDGLLVHDRNLNGIIDDGSELFGNFTPLNPNNNPSDRILAVNGYHALKSYDMNSDGIIDSNDEIYKHLKVWQDINSDGISQENELKSLEQVNIKSLNLAFNNIDKDLDNGNNVMFEGNYTDSEGKEYKMADINFNVDTVSSKHKDDIVLNQEQANQINLKGSGNLKDLNQAAVLSSTLNDILNSYKQANTKEEQLSLLPNLIQEWARTSVGLLYLYQCMPIYKHSKIKGIGFNEERV